MRLLYVHATVVPPPVKQEEDRFFLLSGDLEGDVLQPAWFRSPEEIENRYGPGSYPVYTSGRFRYHWFLIKRYTPRRRKFAQFWFYLSKGFQLHRERPFDCVMAYSHMTVGLYGSLLKLLTRAKLIIEIATSPDLIYITNRPRPTLRDRLMRFYSDICLHLNLWMSDQAHLLYESQLASYPLLARVRRSVFHEFVAVKGVPPRRDGEEQYILLAGAPWYLKGADLLVQAFRRLSPDFQQVKLKLMGYYPDREGLDALVRGCENIEIVKAKFHPEALQMISGATIVAMPSRCEGMGRVALEAMSAGIPVVASNAGGIPRVVRDGENGYLFPSGDAGPLESRLRELLSSRELRERMGARGREMVRTLFSEQVYVQEFTRMVKAAIEGQD